MAKFKVTVAGNNFKLHIEGKVNTVSFLKTWFLEAVDEEAAEEEAMYMVGDDLQDKVLNEKTDSPEMYIQDLRVLDENQNLPPNDSDYVWYEDGEDRLERQKEQEPK